MRIKQYQSRELDGVVLVDKPSGPSSNTVLQQLKHLYQAKKAGHGGTLDPLASGALVIAFGKATRLLRFLLDGDKTYQVEAQLGSETTTGDCKGEVIAQHKMGLDSDSGPTEDTIRLALSSFEGEGEQVPPMYSALKHKGRPLYKLAREGQTIERAPRKVILHKIRFDHYDPKDQSLSFAVSCSKGTYIRTLVEDIGRQLGVGAHLKALRRLTSAPFDQAVMVTPQTLVKLAEQQSLTALDDYLLPTEAMVSTLPALTLSRQTILEVRHGQRVTQSIQGESGWVRVHDQEGSLIAVGLLNEGVRPLTDVVWLHDPLVNGRF